MSIAQPRPVVPPTSGDGSLQNFSQIVQSNMQTLFQTAHVHKIVTSDPAANDGAVGDIYIVQGASGTYLTTKIKTGWVKQTDGTVRVDDFGAYGDGLRDDSAAIQAAHDFIVKSGISAVLEFSSKTYKCATGLTINVNFVSIRGNCATLDFSVLTTGVAMTVVGGGHTYFGNPFYSADKEIAQLTITGNDRAGSVIGIKFTTSDGTGTGPAHSSYRNVVVNTFGTGFYFGDGAYLMSFFNCEAWQCGTCVNAPSANDSGENNSFYGCKFYNSDNGFLYDNVIADFSFYNSSFDGCSSTYISVTSGTLSLFAPHFEGNFGTNQPTNPKFITNPVGVGSRSVISIYNPTFIVKQAQAGDNLAVPIIGIYGTTCLQIFGGTGIMSGGAFVAPATGSIESLTGVSDILILNYLWSASSNLYGTFTSNCTTTFNAYNSSDFSTSKAITAASYGVDINKLTWGTVAPATGVHQQGDIVWNKGALSAGFAGWICVAAGTPGTWKTFGLIS